MPDITMCNDKECPKRMKCYRFTALVNKNRQSYFIESPREWTDCDYFIDNK